MEQVWLVAALWLVVALAAMLLSISFAISTALSEIIVGTLAQLIIGALIGPQALGGVVVDHVCGGDRCDRSHISGRR